MKKQILSFSLLGLLVLGFIPSLKSVAGLEGRINTATALAGTALGLGVLGAGLGLRNAWVNRGFGSGRLYGNTGYWGGGYTGYPVSMAATNVCYDPCCYVGCGYSNYGYGGGYGGGYGNYGYGGGYGGYGGGYGNYGYGGGYWY